MKDESAIPFQIVLYEGNGAHTLDDEKRTGLVTGLLERGYAVTRVSTAGNGLGLERPPVTEERIVVLGDFGGNPPELEDAAGATAIQTHDIASLEGEETIGLVESLRGDLTMNQPGNPTAEGTWKPWFPVIDYDRCTNCMQCLSFCLFDVYGVDDNHQIEVRNNDNCKTNCPACSRVCPEVAIMFPKYSQGPINGEPVSEKDLKREKMKVDISALLGGDIYSKLRERSEQAKSRFSTERSSDKALAERQRCLTKLQQDGLVPAEVLASIDLASLPSPDQIKEKAEAAAAAAAAAEKARTS